MPHRVPPVDPAAHAAHDADLVAAYAAGDATGAELEAATTLVAACGGCAALHRDLRVIAAALPAMPAPRRTRDFRLTPEQAASLRPAGWRRLLAPFAGTRFAFAAPLGSGLAALGIVGILLAGPGLSMGGATAGDGGEAAPVLVGSPGPDGGLAGSPPGTAAPAPEVQGPALAPGVDKSADPETDTSNQGAYGTAAPVEAVGTPGEAIGGPADRPGDETAPGQGNLPLLLLAAAMLVVGVMMTGLRILSRRIG